MQQTTLYSISIPPMRASLVALSALLDKASAHAEAKSNARTQYAEALLASRLIFDQFDLKRQIQIACDNAKGTAARLSGKEVPKHDDTETTFVELKARIEKTIAFMDTILPEEVNAREEAHITLPYHEGKYLTGFEYVTCYALRNFYFHLTTAYSILRANGVEVGKADFMGPLPFNELQ